VPELKFLLSERQAACILTGSSPGDPGTSVRRLFFSAEAHSPPRNEPQCFDGRIIQHNCIVNVEETAVRDGVSTIDVFDVSIMHEGLPAQMHIDANVQLPTPMFQQLLEADMDKTAIWASFEVPLSTRDKYGRYKTMICSRVRFSLLPDTQSRAPARDYSPILKRIFWALVVIAFGVLCRLI